ncbi:hypothetical protein [Streptomyces sp. NPDC048188]|uniref:hypothetical protein n=1 Tax=Streptomyces sp. NPDC048188 TaxID=3155749 RepID=UPI00341FF59D
MATLPFDPIAMGTTMLALPRTLSLTDSQREGEDCPWCGTELTTGTRVDLGARPGPYGTTIHPWGCPACVAEQARKAYSLHSRTCTTCVRDQYGCETRRLLRRLALETRR